MNDWSELIRLTGGTPVVIERVRLKNSSIAIEGSFEPPPLAALSPDDQVFLAAFVKNHGSIKEMERIFGVSYPTVKGRLNRIAQMLDFVDVRAEYSSDDVLERLERGELTVDEAVERLKK